MAKPSWKRRLTATAVPIFSAAAAIATSNASNYFSSAAAFVPDSTRTRHYMYSSRLKMSIDEQPNRRQFLQTCSTTATAVALSSALLPGNTGNTYAAATSSTQQSTPTFSSTVDVDRTPIIPFSTRREYKHIFLSNGLRVLLVHDQGVKRACAALSIGNAGQFSDPDDLPGCAHLVEHITLSSRPKNVDFDDWLGDYDGGSNGFTGAGKVCFHFNCPSEILPEALNRFAALFDERLFKETCHNEAVIRREVRRIDSELDLTNDSTRAFYLLKNMANPDHPFARFGAGNLQSLEKNPQVAGISVSERVENFFVNNYIPEKAVLVVVSPDNVKTLERMVAPFADKLSTERMVEAAEEEAKEQRPLTYPMPFPKNNYTQTILVKAKDREDVDMLSLEWPLNLEYDGLKLNGDGAIISAPTIGFVVSQIFGRQGPESLHSFLTRRQWVPSGLKGTPRISFPVDVSGFQVMKMDLGLTSEGFANRSAVIAAVLDCIKAISRIAPRNEPYLLPREQLSQYLTIATIHGYTLAPRPPDAVELAVDAQTFGVDGQSGIGVLGSWPLVPSADDLAGFESVRRAVASTLEIMADPTKAIATITARRQSITNFVGGLVDPSLPALSSAQWKREPLTDAQYFVENVANLDRLVVAPLVWALSKVDGDELGPPVINPLVPPRLRPARPVLARGSRYYFLDGANDDSTDGRWREFFTQSAAPAEALGEDTNQWKDRALSTSLGDRWKLFQAAPDQTNDGVKLPMPMISPEPSCRGSFVIQLLSSRPKEATSRQAARAQLWLLSFDDDIHDLAELGAPAGLAYDLSFNKYGLRICFRGVSQTLPSYARRFCRRLAQHHARLVDGLTISPSTKVHAFQQASQLPAPPLRRSQIISNIRVSSPLDAAVEGLAFLNSCDGGLAFAQGDILPTEALKLTNELKSIFSKLSTDAYSTPIQPNVKEILYKPMWKPQTSSPLLIPGVALIADACGRVSR